ncbi:PspC domain-containing protein, partial [Xanthomonas citri pv. citri]|nr:PspC domain-containing protein [Xanthomonas citri pv. citri]
MEKRLYKSNTNKVIDGVCGGIGEYFNIDPTLVRLAWVVFCALGGSGL